MSLPKVKIEKVELIDSNYVNRGQTYSALKLIEHSKKFKVFDLPLIGIDLYRKPWEIKNIDDFCYHVQRVMKTDLKHPIILDYYGTVCDGWHRVCKAILLGKTTIKAIRLETMPECDSFKKPENDEKSKG